MRAFLVLLGSAAALAGAATADATPRTALAVTYWAEGMGAGAPVEWTLRCSPAGGSLPRAAAACVRVAKGGWRLFAPVAKNAVCTEIYGGPQTALVVGVVRGRRVWAKLQRRNGCEIERWSRVSPWLVPAGGTP